MWVNILITFRGNSRIINYNGDVIIDAGKEEKLILAEVDEKSNIKKDLVDECDDIIAEVKKHKWMY